MRDAPHADMPRLSICIATFNRGAFIAETLDSIVPQLAPEIELVIVDGASTDATREVVERYAARHPRIRYLRESENSGIDADYDKAVGYATGEYCWLMTDDDLMNAGAVARVLEALGDDPDLVVVNAQVCNVDLSRPLMDRFLDFAEDRSYPNGSERFFTEVANYLSFIGAVVIRRALWLERDRASFYGTLFIHVGVIFQAPLPGPIHVLAAPLIRIRYGNAMWTSRGFEVWMFKWPGLIWSFAYPEAAKAAICAKEPWKSFRKLVHSRGIGSYSMTEFARLIAGTGDRRHVRRARWVARMPGRAANAISGLYCLCVNRQARATAFDLARSPHSTWLSRLAARSLET
jgi:glycosyltransferase involved in cell wall biosynthesis